jgi:hypothetical protein
MGADDAICIGKAGDNCKAAPKQRNGESIAVIAVAGP